MPLNGGGLIPGGGGGSGGGGGLPAGAEGDLLEYTNGAWTGLVVGADGEYLGSNGTDPVWSYGALTTQTGTTYSLATTDANSTILFTGASPIAVTLPSDATAGWTGFPVIVVVQDGTAAVTITGAAGVTVNGTSAGAIQTFSQYQYLTCQRVGTNTWLITRSKSLNSPVSSYITGSNVSCSSATNITSIALPADRWEISGVVLVEAASAAAQADVWIGPSSAATTSAYSGAETWLNANASVASIVSLAVPPTTVILTATTTVYLIGGGDSFIALYKSVKESIPNTTGIYAVPV